jgi:hypothetical protein
MSVAVIGLSWDGFDLQRADLDIHFEITEGLDELPETRGSDDVIPFRRGRLAQERMADRRPIVAVGWVTRPSASPAHAYRVYIDSLKARLNPIGPPRLLVATLEDGQQRWLSAVPRDLIGGPALGSDFRPFSIEWEALDPYWYSTWGSLALDAGYLLDDGWFLDSSAEVLITGAKTFDTLGTTDVERVRVRFVGPSAGPVGIEIPSAVPLGFTVNRLLVAGETLDVDNFARTVTLGGASLRNLLTLRPANQHGEYLRLPPGEVTLMSTGGAAETRVLFSPTYL